MYAGQINRFHLRTGKITSKHEKKDGVDESRHYLLIAV
jgi:hypothetical protein